MSETAVLPGCEAWSVRAGSSVGVLVVHGFTGAPYGMRRIAESLVAAGYDVELPRLPGHGTTIADMLPTRWADWAGEVARARAELEARVDVVIAVGQSMGGSLVVHAALHGAAFGGVVCINPLTMPCDAAMLEMIDDFLEDGVTTAPGEGSDIADPEAIEVSYPATPLAPLRSLMSEGVAPICDRYGELTMPLRLFTSRHDHVVDPSNSDHLASTWGGNVARTWLERGYHVASVDYDRQIIIDETVAFVAGFATARVM